MLNGGRQFPLRIIFISFLTIPFPFLLYIYRYIVAPLFHTHILPRMQNEKGENVDLYVPRKCSYTHRLLTSKDHGSVQINVGNVDPVTGRYTGEFTPIAISGAVRFKSEGDMALTDLVRKNDAL